MEYDKEPNPVSGYFSEGSAVSTICDTIRLGFNKNDMLHFDPRLLRRAQAEIIRKRRSVDAFNMAFMPFVRNSLYGEFEDVRTNMMADGTLYGRDQNLETVLSIDLGVNPFVELNSYNDIIDCRLTEDKTTGYLFEKDVRNKLLDLGFTKFDIKASRFFNIREKDLLPFIVGNKPDYTGLVPLISYIGGHLFTEPPIRSDKGFYLERIFPFYSSRQKTDIQEKGFDKLSSEKPLTEEDIISDWLAYRIVVKDMDLVEKISDSLEDNTRLGEHIKTILVKKDYYKKPKSNGYMSKHYRVIGRIKGRECLLEFQIVDFEQYFENEISIESSQSRYMYELDRLKEEKGLRPEKKELRRYYKDVLHQIFGSNITPINIEDMTITRSQPSITHILTPSR